MSTEALRGGLEALVLRLSSRYARLCTFAQGDWDTLDGESLVEADHLNHLLTELRALLAEHPPADLPVATGDAGTEDEHEHEWTRCEKCPHDDEPCPCSGERCPACPATSAAGSSPEDADECCCETSPPEFGGRLTDRECPLHGEDAGEWVALREKWLSASEAARKAEHHFPADCLAEAAQVVQSLYGHLAAVEQERERAEARAAREANDAQEWGVENSALREQLAAVGLVVERWIARGVPVRGGGDGDEALFELQGAIADPASVLAQRDAEVGAKALEEARAAGPSSTPTDELWQLFLDKRARGLRQGVEG